MSTATVEDPAADKVFSERELEKQEETLRETREKLVEMRKREEELSTEIADAVEAGEDPSELRSEREEVRDWISDMEPVLPVLEQRIEARRRRKLRADAEERLQEIKKKCGGLSGEQGRKIERAVEYLEKAREQLERAGEAYALGQALRSEAHVLGRVFGLDVPELRRVPSPKTYDRIVGAGAVAGLLNWSPSSTLASFDRMAGGAGRARDEEPQKAIGSLEGIDVPLDSPTRDLLDRLAELEQDEDDR